MAARLISETERVRYLLGLSSPAEREHIESEYLEDDDAFQEMLAAEDDLIDAYACGELTGEERRRFEEIFVTGARGRVKFARAFAGVVSATRSVETKHRGTLLDMFQSAGLLRAATIAAVIVFAAILAWLINDRQRMTNELRELRVQSAELRKRTEELQRTSNTERTVPTGQRTLLVPEPVKPSHRERATTATQRARSLPKVKNDREVRNNREKFEITPKPGEQLVGVSDATLPPYEKGKITQLPLNADSVTGLISLKPATSSTSYVGGGRADQAGITLDGVELRELGNTYSLLPRNMMGRGETTIRIPNSLTWIRFQLLLETGAIHDDYRVTIKTADDHPVTSADWIEPFTSNRTIIDTPAISTSDLPSGNYLLLLMGKESDGSFVRVADYSFLVIKD